MAEKHKIQMPVIFVETTFPEFQTQTRTSTGKYKRRQNNKTPADLGFERGALQIYFQLL